VTDASPHRQAFALGVALARASMLVGQPSKCVVVQHRLASTLDP
jgi:hypothetical protein